jgi:hypothetical protein
MSNGRTIVLVVIWVEVVLLLVLWVFGAPRKLAPVRVSVGAEETPFQREKTTNTIATARRGQVVPLAFAGPAPRLI